ncbi:MAG: prepilin-type N-terminal cleavage/methylation domain-containing protein [Candidatus Riflebacteria bacterium]|nr:prepilin-type N-terminal cleavage/methylation domain-containing protein [Candidatus Riflebacteria bacterium]
MDCRIFKMKNIGITLVEVLVAFFILTLISGGIFFLLREASLKNSISEARSIAKQEAGKILSVMQHDFAQAKLGSIKVDEPGKIGLDIDSGGRVEKIVYSWHSPKFYRTLAGKEWLMSEHLENFLLTRQATGQYIVELETKVRIDGLTNDSAQSHSQNQMIVSREDSTSLIDPNWRDVGDVNGIMSTHGDLMGGIRDDMNMVSQNFTNELKKIKDDAASATVDQIMEKTEQIRSTLFKNIENINSKIENLDGQIANMAEEGIINITHKLFERTGRKKECAAKMRQILVGAKKSTDLKWDQIEAVANDYGYGSEVQSSFKSIFQAKKDLFGAGSEVIKTLDDLKISTEGIDRGKFS